MTTPFLKIWRERLSVYCLPLGPTGGLSDRSNCPDPGLSHLVTSIIDFR